MGGVPLTQDVKRIEQIRRSVGMVFQHFNLFPICRCWKTAVLRRCGCKKPRKEAEEQAMRYLERVRIAEQAKNTLASYPAVNSSGSRLPARCACTPT